MMQVSIDSRLEHVWLIGVIVRAVAAQIGFGSVDSFHMELAVVEAVNNTIEHSYEGRSGCPVDISLGVESNTLEFVIADEGRPIPPKALTVFEVENVESEELNMTDGGRGLQIIRDVMDTVNYEHHGRRNQLRLTKRLSTATV